MGCEIAGRDVRRGWPRLLHSKIIVLMKTSKKTFKRLGELVTNNKILIRLNYSVEIYVLSVIYLNLYLIP